MAAFTADPKHFTVAGAYYPTDHVFAMFADAAAAQAAATRMAEVPLVVICVFGNNWPSVSAGIRSGLKTPAVTLLALMFGISESEVIELMRSELKESSFKLWRKRVNSGVSQKHRKKRIEEINRFKCSRQRVISNNKISKR